MEVQAFDGGSVVASGVGAKSAEVVRDRSARSIKIVRRVVRGRGPPVADSSIRSYQNAFRSSASGISWRRSSRN